MMISCFPATESQLRQMVEMLKEAGLGNQYEEQARGETLMLSVRTETFDEKEKVKAILRDAGVNEFWYGDENVA
jgi:hypothetical protein